jgi:serine/threonine protein kinase
LPSIPELTQLATQYLNHRLIVGETVGVFRILEILDRQGNVSTVYLGEATVDAPQRGIARGTRFIIKGIPYRPSSSGSTNARNLRSFFNEIRVLPHIPDPGSHSIVRLVDTNGDPARGKVFMAFEELAFQSVREKYPDKRVDPDIVLGFARCLTRALMHLHSLGIAHGDVKPDNFMLDLKGDAILVDFGSAFFTGRKGVGKKKGVQPPDPDEYREPFTPLYCSPELARYKLYGGTFNPKEESSDSWALGVTLWELLAGERPFSWMKSESLSKILEEIGRGTIPVRADLLTRLAESAPHPTIADTYRFLQRLIQRFLVVDPLKRLSCFEAHGEILAFGGTSATEEKRVPVQKKEVQTRLEMARRLARLDEPMTGGEKDLRPSHRRRKTAAMELRMLEMREEYLKSKKSKTSIQKGWVPPPTPKSPSPAKSTPPPDLEQALPKKKPTSESLTFEDFVRRRKADEIERMKAVCEEGSSTQMAGDTSPGLDTDSGDPAETSVDLDPMGSEGEGEEALERMEETRVDPSFGGYTPAAVPKPEKKPGAPSSRGPRRPAGPGGEGREGKKPVFDPQATRDDPELPEENLLDLVATQDDPDLLPPGNPLDLQATRDDLPTELKDPPSIDPRETRDDFPKVRRKKPKKPGAQRKE